MRGRIEVLGSFCLSSSAVDRPQPIDRRMELLAVLACADGPVPRSVLSALFWTDSPRANANLRQLASRVRALELPGFEVAPGALAWAGASDAREFRAAFDARRWADAWSLYRGDVLEGHAGDVSAEFGEWLHATRRRFRDEACVAGVRLAAELEARDPLEALGVLRRLLELDPYAEDAVERYLRLAERAGLSDLAVDVAERFQERLRDELDLELPEHLEALLHGLRQRAARSRRDHAAPRVRGLPEAPTPCVGRRSEVAACVELLSGGRHRLVTVMGPGGVGKTRLAWEIARALGPRLRDGGAYVPVAGATTPAELCAAVALALSLREADASTDRVAHALRDRELLLVLDNFEQLAGASPVLDGWLRTCPGLHFLVTSRRRLGSSWERVFALAGFSRPPGADDPAFTDHAGVRMFLLHAQRIDPDVRLLREDRRALEELLVRVEAVPLAIELAASWSRALPLSTLAREVRRDLDALSGSSSASGMRMVFERSWSLLDRGEQEALAASSLFRGGFSLEAFRHVADAEPGVLASLVDASLVQRRGDRYDLHELIRQYAAERLAADPRLQERAERRFLDHAAHWLGSLGGDVTGGPRQVAALAAVDAELGNVRHAWRRAIEHEREDVIAAALEPLWRTLEVRGSYREGLELLRAAEDVAWSPNVLAILLARIGALAHRVHEWELCREVSERSLGLSERAGSPPDWTAVVNLALLPWFEGDHDAAIVQHRRALEIGERHGDVQLQSAAHEHLALNAEEHGNVHEAERHHLDALRLARRIGDRWMIALTLSNLGTLYHRADRATAARGILHEALALARQIDFKMIVTASASLLAAAHGSEGRWDRALQLYREAYEAGRDLPTAAGELVDARMGMGEALSRLGRAEEASEALRAASQAADELGDVPRAARAWELLARHYLQADAREELFPALVHLESLDPDRAEAVRETFAMGRDAASSELTAGARSFARPPMIEP